MFHHSNTNEILFCRFSEMRCNNDIQVTVTSGSFFFLLSAMQSKVVLFCFVFLRRGLAMWPRLAWKLTSSCFKHLDAEVIDMPHHTWLM
jgi:hypothetical protein